MKNKIENITIDIIIPVYNTPKWMLDQCFNSVIQQTFLNWRLIVVDDGSSNSETLQTLKYFSEVVLEKFVLITIEHKGIGAARNIALERANADFVVFLDSDDFFETKYLETLCEPLKNENYDIVFCGYALFNYAGNEKIFDFPKENLLALNKIEQYFRLDCGSKMFKLNFVRSQKCRFSESNITGGITFSDIAFSSVQLNKIATVLCYGYYVRDRDDSVCRSKKLFNTATVEQFVISDFEMLLHAANNAASELQKNVLLYRMMKHMLLFCWLFSCYSSSKERNLLVKKISKFIKSHLEFQKNFSAAKVFLKENYWEYCALLLFRKSIFYGFSLFLSEIAAQIIRLLYVIRKK